MKKLENLENFEEIQKNKKEEKSENKLYLLIIFFLILAVTIGYARLSSTLKFIGIGDISKTSWDVHFENLTDKGNKVQLLEPASIKKDDTYIEYSINLLELGSYYEFETDIKNGGTIDAKLDSMPELSGISVEQDAYTNYAITYSDGSAIKIGDVIKAGESKRVKVRVELELDKNITEEQLPKNAQTLDLSIDFNYIQSNVE